MKKIVTLFSILLLIFTQFSSIAVNAETRSSGGGTVELTKVDAGSNSGGGVGFSTRQITLQGAEFKLVDGSGNVLEENLVTDQNGKLLLSGLPIGKYALIETKAPEGYILDATPIEFEITADNLSQVIQLTKENVKASTTGTVELTKVDAGSNSGGGVNFSARQITLQGAEFKLVDGSGNVLEENLVTDQNGKLLLSGLPIGKYALIETKAPEGYILDATPIEFEITADNLSQVIQLTKENIKKEYLGSVALTKLDETTKKVLQGAIFELQDSTGKMLKANLVTNSEGEILISDLEPGNYQFVETQSPNGYALDRTPVKFTIKENGTNTVQVTKTNKLILGKVVLTKKNSETKEVLKNAVFELQDVNGKTIKSNLITNQKGELSVENLPIGDYQFVEKTAPSGYILDGRPVKFSITKEKTQVYVDAFNEREKPIKEVPKISNSSDTPDKKDQHPDSNNNLPSTGESGSIWWTLLGVVIVFIVILLGYFGFKKKI